MMIQLRHGDGTGIRRRQIGVIVPTGLEFGRQILRGVRTWCGAQTGVEMVIISELGFMPKLCWPRQPLDCLVILHGNADEVASLRDICPQIVVTSNKEPMTGVAQVINDERAIGEMGAQYLINLGYHSMAFVHADQLQFSHQRLAGFLHTVADSGRDCHILNANGPDQLREELPRLQGIADPIAVMATSDLHARWLIESLEAPETLIPNKLVVLGVDDDDLQSSLSRIPISSIAVAGERIGYEAAALGMRLATGETALPEPLRIAPLRVVKRRSTDAMAVRDTVALKILRTITEKMSELEDAGDLIQRVGIPRRTLEPKFRAATGMSLAGAIAEARIARARELLATTDLSIKEVSFLIGFSEPRMLTLVFKRLTGELPTEYRRRIHLRGG